MSNLILPAGLRSPTLPTLSGYSRRQLLALERPEETERDINFASNEPCKREVEVIKDIQLVSILTVDLDDEPVWHARVGWMESKGHTVPLRAWQDWMVEPAMRTAHELISLPRSVEQVRRRTLDPGRPSTMHYLIKLTPLEKEYMKAIKSGFVEPQVWIKEPRKFGGDS